MRHLRPLLAKVTRSLVTEILWARIVQFYPTFSEFLMHIGVKKRKTLNWLTLH
jgi:hypothetical protein